MHGRKKKQWHKFKWRHYQKEAACVFRAFEVTRANGEKYLYKDFFVFKAVKKFSFNLIFEIISFLEILDCRVESLDVKKNMII